MQAVKSDRPVMIAKPANRFISIALIIVILIMAVWVVFNSYTSRSTLIAATVISQSALEETYGLRVNLVAVTGAGGFVDVRLKMVDGEKAKLLLSDPKNFPSLSTEAGVVLSAPENTKAQKMSFENGGNMFVMYPNSGNAVIQGSHLTILFGNIALEPITAR